jgi:tetratricopeptide (TPR) repeat protein
MRIPHVIGCIGGCALAFAALPDVARAAESCASAVGRLVSVEGRIEIQHPSSTAWSTGKLNDALCQGDLIRAGEHSRATVQLINQAVLRIDQNTAMRLDKITAQAEERSAFSLIKGAFQSFSRKPRGFEVSTPYLNGSIEGTEFVFRVEDEESVLTVLEGTVIASNDQGRLPVPAGTAVAARAGQAPQPRTVVHPRDAVQWSLYYPPVMVEPAPPAGTRSEAQTLLDDAASLLSVGRVEEAYAEIDKALAKDPDAGLAYALKAVINVTQNNDEQALADGKQAVKLSPGSAAAKIALSYAQQASFDIPAARDTLLQAVEEQPRDALAWARLSELQLMLGDREQARESAQKATSLNPDLSRTQITLGFAALAEFDNDKARRAFERAIELDSSDPLPHLGLGLEKISSGDLQAGGSDIEVAVALDSNDSLLRSYLGKTYFEEKRSPLDFEQYDIAKQLDPRDPTPWLYSGIARQTVNQPVKALGDLEKSIELNDNRAVYRGRLLLDKDRAARGTSQARVYQNLGFDRTAIQESTKSLDIDPANSSAHRFLSDAQRDVSQRTEISRVSELLQAQLLQDVNINPVQPSISSTNLNIVTLGGPAAAGFNEFTPLFERNETQFNVSGLLGNHDTKAGEAVLSTVHDDLSASGGAFRYDTNGFRDNDNLKHTIYDLYGQWAVNPVVNVQTEFENRNTNYGDIAMHFDPEDFDPTLQRKLEAHAGRVGVRISPGISSTILLSAIYSDRKGTGNQAQFLDFGPPFGTLTATFDGEVKENLYQYDAAYIYESEEFNITAGGAYANDDRKDNITTALPPFIPPTTDEYKTGLDDKRVYTYGNITAIPHVIGTVGASYHDYDASNQNFDQVNPKLGVRVAPTDNLEVRAAFFKVVKPVLSSNRTLEPTQVAGFNQFFDDANGTKSTRYGLGVDGKVTPEVLLGAEYTRRKIDWPITPPGGGDVYFENRDEWLHRLYAYWTPLESLAVDASLVFDKFENENDSTVSDAIPQHVKTYSAPVAVRYFHPSGAYAGVKATYVDQDVQGASNYQYHDGKSNFTFVDLVVGYRLPKRWGLVSVGVQNVFDKNFDYLDDSYRNFQDEPTVGPYIPSRAVVGQVTLNLN